MAALATSDARGALTRGGVARRACTSAHVGRPATATNGGNCPTPDALAQAARGEGEYVISILVPTSVHIPRPLLAAGDTRARAL
jgi:hypothetical protein